MSERGFLSLFNLVRTGQFQSGLPAHLWGYSASHALYTLNQCISVNSSCLSEHEVFTRQKPQASFLRLFGVDCFIHNKSKTHLGKLDKWGIPAKYLGKAVNQKGFIVITNDEKKIMVGRTVRFLDIDATSSFLHDDLDPLVFDNDDGADSTEDFIQEFGTFPP